MDNADNVENYKEKYLVPAIERAFAVLEYVISSDRGCTFNTIIKAKLWIIAV